MSMFVTIAALVGGALRIGGRIANQVRLGNAIDEAKIEGREQLDIGIGTTTQNAMDLAQDLNANLALSGVRSDFGTAAFAQERNVRTRDAQINAMREDHQRWERDLEESRDVGMLNTVLGSLGDVFSTMGNIYMSGAADKVAGGKDKVISSANGQKRKPIEGASVTDWTDSFTVPKPGDIIPFGRD